MAVIWVLEKPRPREQSTIDLLQGDFAVRSFASLLSFLRLAPMKSQNPDLILVRTEDFQDDLMQIEAFLPLHYETVPCVYLGESPALLTFPHAMVLELGSDSQLVFQLKRLFESQTLAKDAHLVQWSGVVLDVEAARLKINADSDWRQLSPKEAKILHILMKNPDSCLSHQDLTAEIWKGAHLSSRSVASHMSRLRRSLQGSPLLIRNVYGGGYQLAQLGAEEG